LPAKSSAKVIVSVSKALSGKMSAKVCCANLVPISSVATIVVTVVVGMTAAVPINVTIVSSRSSSIHHQQNSNKERPNDNYDNAKDNHLYFLRKAKSED
jgi:hypothetical protein